MEKNNYHFIDTHCHINLLVKKEFDVSLTDQQIKNAKLIIDNADNAKVKQIVNVGTNVIESINCIGLAQAYSNLFTVVGIHPTDLDDKWKDDLKKIEKFIKKKEKNKIVGIGEIGIDKYRPGYNLQRQIDGLRVQITLALKYDLSIVIHTRAAPEETLTVLQEFKNDIKRGIIHCFPYDLTWAQDAIDLNFHLGVGGTITYPNNKTLPPIIKELSLSHIVLETDAPYLPPQPIRGQRNSPSQIPIIAQFIADLKNVSLSKVANTTTTNAQQIFMLPKIIC